MPCSELHVDAYLKEVDDIVSKIKCPELAVKIIKGKELEQNGFGGLWGVGKAAAHLPALAILSYKPKVSKKTFAWVGKGYLKVYS